MITLPLQQIAPALLTLALAGQAAGADCDPDSGSMEQATCISDLLGPMRISQQPDRVRLEQDTEDFSIEAAFPRLPATGPGAQRANEIIEQLVLEQVDAFQLLYLDFREGGKAPHQGAPWLMSIDASDPYAAPRFWTLRIQTYHFTGGAHGGTDDVAVVLDRSTGEQIPPAGLFRTGSDWLQVLSDNSFDRLSQREPFAPDDDWLARGTAPEPGNYNVLLPLEDGLHLVFGQYQIGPYAIGVTELMVPYTALSGILNPDLFPQGD